MLKSRLANPPPMRKLRFNTIFATHTSESSSAQGKTARFWSFSPIGGALSPPEHSTAPSIAFAITGDSANHCEAKQELP